MIRQCCVCREVQGEKEPLEDKTITHTICADCEKYTYPACMFCDEATDGRALCPECTADFT